MSDVHIRAEKVTAMVDAMLETLADHPATLDSNVYEIVSATMTVCLRVVKVSLARGADPAAIRRGLDNIYMHCTGDVVH